MHQFEKKARAATALKDKPAKHQWKNIFCKSNITPWEDSHVGTAYNLDFKNNKENFAGIITCVFITFRIVQNENKKKKN